MSADGICGNFEAQRFRPNFCKTCLKAKLSHISAPAPPVAASGPPPGARHHRRKSSTGAMLPPPAVRPVAGDSARKSLNVSGPVRSASDARRGLPRGGGGPPGRGGRGRGGGRGAPRGIARPSGPTKTTDPKTMSDALEGFKRRQSMGPGGSSKISEASRRASTMGVVNPTSPQSFLATQEARGDPLDACKFIPEVLLRHVLLLGLGLTGPEAEELMRTAVSLSKKPPAIGDRLLLGKSESRFLAQMQEKIERFREEQTELRRVVSVQSCARRWLVTKRFQALSDSEYNVMRKRNDTYLDLVRTEKSYIHSIENLIQCFVVPLRKSDFIEPHECASMFSNIEQIADAHRDLLRELEKAADDWPFLSSVGRIFLHINPMLKAYNVFVGNFKNAINEIERMQQENPKFAAFIAEQEHRSVADLQTLLSMPVNRISQYEHHLHTLSETVTDAGEYQETVQAYSVLSQSSTVVQKSLVQSAETAKILGCQRRLKSEKPLALMKPDRRLLAEAKFKKHTLMLFNDSVIVSKAAEKTTFRGAGRLNKGSAKSDKKKNFGEDLRVKAVADLDAVELKETGDKTFELKVEDQLFKIQAGTAEDKYSWVRSFRWADEEKNRAKVFGVALADTVAREERNNGIPYVLEKTASYLLQEHLDTAGLFRVAGSKTEILEMQAIFDKGGETAVNHDLSKNNVYSVCDCFKSYFRALPEPLLGYNLYKPLLELMSDGSVPPSERVAKIKELIYMWTPSFAVKVMKFLVQFLRVVSQHSESNKMTVANLSIVFGPTLLWPMENTLESAMDMPYINSCVEAIIQNMEDVFD